MCMPKIKSIFVVIEDLYDEERGFQASILYENCQGFFPTSQFFGHDYQLATEIAFEKNLSLGLTREEQSRIISFAMGMTGKGGNA